MAKFLRTLMSLAFVLGVAAVAVPGTASAAPTAHLTKTQHLTATPDSGMARSCTVREIVLARGHYDWGLREGSSSFVKRINLFLAAGKYRWDTCLKPQDRKYAHSSTLVPLSFPGDAVAIAEIWKLDSSGTYTWGSFLDPRF